MFRSEEGIDGERVAPLSAEVACDSRPCYGVDGLFPHALSGARRSKPEEIDRSIAIVVEAAQNLNRAIFSLKSKAKKFDGLAVGFRPSEEIFCAYKTARYDALRGSSGSELGWFQTIPLRAENRTISLTDKDFSSYPVSLHVTPARPLCW